MPTRIDLDKKLLLNLYRKEELSTYKISQKLGCSQTCIYNNLLRNKIPIISNSQRYKGKPGRPHTEESRKKMSISKLGDKNPAKRIDVRMKISKANKGRKFSKETRENMSKAQKGRIIKWDVKISIAMKKWYASKQGKEFVKKLQQRKGSNNPMFEKSDEIKTRHWTRLWDQDAKEQLIKKFREFRMMQRFPVQSTKIEKIMEEELKRRDIDFVTHYSILNICQPDIVLPEYKLAIQCDGDWWHANTEIYKHRSLSKIQKNNIKRDRCQDSLLRANGWHVMRFWESEIKENVSGCGDKIEKFLKEVEGETTK